MTRRCAACLVGLLSIGWLAAAGTTGYGGGSGASSAECSSCQTAYTQEQCERWGGQGWLQVGDRDRGEYLRGKYQRDQCLRGIGIDAQPERGDG
jgi:hypothetical protein